MQTAEFTIIGMRDEQCLRSVVNAIQDLPSIGHVEVSLETGLATIEHGGFVSEGDIRRAVEDSGFQTG